MRSAADFQAIGAEGKVVIPLAWPLRVGGPGEQWLPNRYGHRQLDGRGFRREASSFA